MRVACSYLFGGNLIESIRYAVANFVDGPPSNVLHVNRVGGNDLIHPPDDFFERCLTYRVVVVLVNDAKIHVRAEQVSAFTWNVQD